MSLHDDLIDRVARLTKRRDDLIVKQQAELQALNRQLAGAAQLLAKWNTFTVDEALAAVEQAGLKVRVDG